MITEKRLRSMSKSELIHFRSMVVSSLKKKRIRPSVKSDMHLIIPKYKTSDFQTPKKSK